MFKIFSLFTAFILSQFCSCAQGDSLSHSAPALKRGIYLSYREYLDNNPAVTDSFNVWYIAKRRKDTVTSQAEYHFQDKKHKTYDSWGFCDGQSVFVYYIDFYSVKGKFWKLECLGPNPFFTVARKKGVLLVGPPVVQLLEAAVQSAGSSAQFEMVVIDNSGSVRLANLKVVRKLLGEQPDLLKEFKETSEGYEDYENGYNGKEETEEMYESKVLLMKDYLLRLNGLSK